MKTEVMNRDGTLKVKILVNTVDCWNSHVGSNTLSSWLSGYDSGDLANLYIREEVPDSDVCGRYFKISENKVIKSVVFRGYQTGKEYSNENKAEDAEDIVNLSAQKSRYTFFKKFRFWPFLYLREILWLLGNWKSKELNGFIDSFNPEIILLPLEGYIHFNRINQYIIKRTGAKAVGVFWDDNFTYKPHRWSIGFRIHRFFLRGNLKKTVSLCSGFFAISPQMKTECDKMFNINSIVLTKPVSPSSMQPSQNGKGQPVKMIYTGNLLIGRDKTLELLLKALKDINQDTVKVMLDIYTTTAVSQKLNQTVSDSPGCELKGAVTQSEAITKQKQADVLLFMEALSGKDKYSARLSFSTKLTDYFATGKCIFALGPRGIAPIAYLAQEDAAIVASDFNEIKQKLQTILNPDAVIEYGRKAFECGRRNHSEARIRSVFKKTIQGLYKDMAADNSGKSNGSSGQNMP